MNRIVSELIEAAINVVSENFSNVDKNDDNSYDGVVDVNSKVGGKVKPKLFPCPSCGKMFAQYPSAVKHCSVKKDAKNSICPVCGKVIKDLRNMKRHIETHKVVKCKGSNVCVGCKQIFSTKQKLDDHMMRKHGVQKT